MKVFGSYADYYDLLYQDKDYEAETGFIDQIIKKYSSSSQSILELGCGTGRHGIALANTGYNVHGIDLSGEMLDRAKKNVAALPKSLPGNLSFSHGDVRTVRLNKTFDIILALFHVINYQQTNDDLNMTFETVRSHLNPDGLFIFDCWYGPAVLNEKPEKRTKQVENDVIEITRTAEPVLHLNKNSVDVNYEVSIIDKSANKSKNIHECHRIRYLFMPEVEAFFRSNDMKLLETGEWMSGAEPGIDSWSVYFVGKRAN